MLLKMYFLITLLLVFLSMNSDSAVATEKTRGVHPERMSLYDPTKNFSCLDGSQQIPFGQVNDDYCDCADGSDEPGTAACMNSQFACENLGYVVQPIPSSRVNDGICDCCDGSDEYDGKIKCENTCGVLAAQMRAEEDQLRAIHEQGNLKRKEMIEMGAEFKKAIQVKVTELEAAKLIQVELRTKLEASKQQIEGVANEAKAKQDAIIEEKKKEQAKENNMMEARELFVYLDVNKDLSLTPDELLLHQELDILFDSDGKLTLEEANKLLDSNTAVSFDPFLDTYYGKLASHVTRYDLKEIPEEEKKQQKKTENAAAEPELPSVPVHQEDVNTETPFDPDQQQQDTDVHYDDHNEENDQEEEPFSPPPPPSGDSDENQQNEEHKYDEATQDLINKSNEAKSEFDKSAAELRKIESEIDGLTKKLAYDTGANGEFAGMIDQCYEYEDREYIYKLCMFEKTIQKSKQNQQETSIGAWKGWSENNDQNSSSKYSQAKFENGQGCWNGPARSTHLKLQCGVENKVKSVSEPNRCEYEMVFETPALCVDNQSSTEKHDEL